MRPRRSNAADVSYVEEVGQNDDWEDVSDDAEPPQILIKPSKGSAKHLDYEFRPAPLKSPYDAWDRRAKKRKTRLTRHVRKRAQQLENAEQGAWSGFIEFPMEVWACIATNLDPFTLYQLSRVSKRFAQFLWSKNSSALWKEARRSLDVTLKDHMGNIQSHCCPAPFLGRCEPAYARDYLRNDCSECGREDSLNYCAATGDILCSPCFNDFYWAKSSIKKSLWPYLQPENPLQTRGSHTFYMNGQIEDVEDNLAKLKAKYKHSREDYELEAGCLRDQARLYKIRCEEETLSYRKWWRAMRTFQTNEKQSRIASQELRAGELLEELISTCQKEAEYAKYNEWSWATLTQHTHFLVNCPFTWIMQNANASITDILPRFRDLANPILENAHELWGKLVRWKPVRAAAKKLWKEGLKAALAEKGPSISSYGFVPNGEEILTCPSLLVVLKELATWMKLPDPKDPFDYKGRIDGVMDDLVRHLINEREKIEKALFELLPDNQQTGNPLDLCRYRHQFACKTCSKEAEKSPWSYKRSLQYPALLQHACFSKYYKNDGPHIFDFPKPFDISLIEYDYDHLAHYGPVFIAVGPEGASQVDLDHREVNKLNFTFRCLDCPGEANYDLTAIATHLSAPHSLYRDLEGNLMTVWDVRRREFRKEIVNATRLAPTFHENIQFIEAQEKPDRNRLFRPSVLGC